MEIIQGGKDMSVAGVGYTCLLYSYVKADPFQGSRKLTF